MDKAKLISRIGGAIILVGLIAAMYFLISGQAGSRKPQSFKKDLGRTLEITPGDLVSMRTGSDAGGCEWDQSKADESALYRRAVEKLLRMSVYEMSPEAPAGCATAYYAADDINQYEFVSGRLTIPPSGQYPPSGSGTFNKYYRIVFDRRDGSKPPEFCLEEADFLAVVAKIEENPKFADCEF